MPELPEVETIRRRLAPRVEGRRFERVEILDPRWTRPHEPADVARVLTGRRVERLSRRGKYLLWELAGNVFLAQHLRMTGAVLYDPESDPQHVRVRIHLDDGHLLAYDDPRRFGTGEVSMGRDAVEAFFVERLGVEPFSDAFTPSHLRALGQRSRAPIKAFLLDQRRVAGVGNIYADEALFRARIHPLREARRLRPRDWEALHGAVVETLEEGIEAKGATIDDYRDPDGVTGGFQDRFLVHMREGEPCPRCGTTIRKLVAGGRGTYVCVRCQPVPRRRRSAAA